MKNLSNLHYDYMDMVRHYHPASEPYTGCDALFTALDGGWELDNTVTYEETWLAGARRVVLYTFTLRRGEEKMVMPIVDNPYVGRVVTAMRLELVPVQRSNGRVRKTAP